MYRFAAVVVTVSALVSGIIILILELNESHLFNSGWPSHARLHEAWQLMTNSALSALSVFLICSGRAPGLAILLSLIISIPFPVGLRCRVNLWRLDASHRWHAVGSLGHEYWGARSTGSLLFTVVKFGAFSP